MTTTTPSPALRVPPDPERAWATDSALRAEFGHDKARFMAFCSAAAAGRARIRASTTLNPQKERRREF